MKSVVIAGANADYCREHFIFSRTQSPTVRNMPWRTRAKPVFINVNWGLIGVVAVCALVLVIVAAKVQ